MREHDIYKSMYLFLFNAVTDALADLPEDPNAAKTRLSLAQIKCEKMYIEAGERCPPCRICHYRITLVCGNGAAAEQSHFLFPPPAAETSLSLPPLFIAIFTTRCYTLNIECTKL